MSRRILILSGDTFEIRTLSMSLEVEKFQIERCSNSDQLWTIMGEGAVATALIADMSKASWEEMRSVFRRFRASERGRRTPVLILGKPPVGDEQDKVGASGVNLGDFFPPPIDGVALVRRIRAIPDDGEDPPESFKVSKKGIRGAVIGVGGIPEQGGAAVSQGAFPEQGSLQKITPARLLTVMAREQATGRLELELPDGRSDVFVEGGKVVHLRTRGEIALGHLVVAEGLATEEQVQRLGDAAKMTLDQMIAVGVIGPHQAFDLLKTQLVKWLHRSSSIRSGTYRWRPMERPPEGSFPVDVPLHRTLLDGLVAHPPVPHPLPQKLAQAVPVVTPAARPLLAKLNLNAVESRLVKELDGHARLWNVVQQLSSGDDARQAHLEALVIGLRDIGIVSLKVARSASKSYVRPNLPRRAPGEAPAQPKPVEDETLKKVKAELERIREADPFEIFQVDIEASIDDVRKVFFELSKLYHPDKYYESSEEVKEIVEEIFKYIQDAYTVVSDAEQREAFRKMRLAGSDRPITEDDERNATICARQAQLYLKNRNYQAAKELFEQAAEMNPLEKDHQVYAAWAAHLADPKEVVKNLTYLHGVLMSPHNSPEGFYFFGVMLKVNNDPDQAQKAFQKALSLRPGYREPERELRLMQMRRRKAEEAEGKGKKGGLFGFKRS